MVKHTLAKPEVAGLTRAHHLLLYAVRDCSKGSGGYGEATRQFTPQPTDVGIGCGMSYVVSQIPGSVTRNKNDVE